MKKLICLTICLLMNSTVFAGAYSVEVTTKVKKAFAEEISGYLEIKWTLDLNQEQLIETGLAPGETVQACRSSRPRTTAKLLNALSSKKEETFELVVFSGRDIPTKTFCLLE